jgi:hypothetical protein
MIAHRWGSDVKDDVTEEGRGGWETWGISVEVDAVGASGSLYMTGKSKRGRSM